ncbi:MAG: hypothetical protein QG659_655 [Patescibacteria group bacterium]|nr:hypothetical protein [Patescibacteria group bacterium]
MNTYNRRPGSEDKPSAEVVMNKRGNISNTVRMLVPESVSEADMGCGGRVALSLEIIEIQNAENSKQAVQELRLKCAKCVVSDVCLLGRVPKP